MTSNLQDVHNAMWSENWRLHRVIRECAAAAGVWDYDQPISPEIEQTFPDAIRAKVAQLAELERLRSIATGMLQSCETQLAEQAGLVQEARTRIAYAAESSTVTTSDNPGCFWCDHEEHTEKCWVPGWLARTAPKEAT